MPRRKETGGPLSEAAPDKASAASSFSTTTTKIAPAVRWGPFGSGGTVVGYSKYPGVRSAFERNFAERLELGAQLVIYENGARVVDLYGHAPEVQTYDGATLQCVASSGKLMESLAVAILVDKGLLNYEDPVAKHWPEFGAHGKANITIADVMQHAGGVPFCTDPQTRKVIPLTVEAMRNVEHAEATIAATPKHPPGPKASLCYHACTRGFLVNAILRRADPQKRSIGRFLREEVTEPLSNTETEEPVRFFCGMSPTEQAKHTIADWTFGSVLFTLWKHLLPALLGWNRQIKAFVRMLFLSRDGSRSFVRAVHFPGWMGNPYINSVEGRELELSSGFMLTNARSMARIGYAAMVDGSLDGFRLLKPGTVQTANSGVVTRFDAAMETTLGFTRGGYCQFSKSFATNDETGQPSNDLFHPDDAQAYGDFIGWGGLGGSLSLVDRNRKISVAYCSNGFATDGLWGIRTRRILLELQEALSSSSSED